MWYQDWSNQGRAIILFNILTQWHAILLYFSRIIFLNFSNVNYYFLNFILFYFLVWINLSIHFLLLYCETHRWSLDITYRVTFKLRILLTISLVSTVKCFIFTEKAAVAFRTPAILIFCALFFLHLLAGRPFSFENGKEGKGHNVTWPSRF